MERDLSRSPHSAERSSTSTVGSRLAYSQALHRDGDSAASTFTLKPEVPDRFPTSSNSAPPIVDRLGAERLNVACNHEINIAAVAVGALGA